MKQSPSWEVNQEIPRIVWISEVRYRIHKSPPLVPVLSQIKFTMPYHPISLRFV